MVGSLSWVPMNMVPRALWPPTNTLLPILPKTIKPHPFLLNNLTIHFLSIILFIIITFQLPLSLVSVSDCLPSESS
ncbi:hypothetical protein K1719_044681 [Acacia pycnantha]|nr:hypothetical protein K1719_045460 [Acacia pycnantha]KAI9073340.1 hypothetical protein K1719_044681 [Acacia pycnantha]